MTKYHKFVSSNHLQKFGGQNPESNSLSHQLQILEVYYEE